jgi:hypothetical protein
VRNGPLDDVTDVGPVPRLLAVPPDNKGILFREARAIIAITERASLPRSPKTVNNGKRLPEAPTRESSSARSSLNQLGPSVLPSSARLVAHAAW